jgi:hypothetical protein
MPKARQSEAAPAPEPEPQPSKERSSKKLKPGGGLVPGARRNVSVIQGLVQVQGKAHAVVVFSDSPVPEVVTLTMMHEQYMQELLLFYEEHVTVLDAVDVEAAQDDDASVSK